MPCENVTSSIVPNAHPDWYALELEFIYGHLKGTDFAALYGLKYRTMQDHMRRRGWVERQRKFHELVAANVEESLIRKHIDDAVKSESPKQPKSVDEMLANVSF